MFLLLVLSCGPNIKSFGAIKFEICVFSCFSGRYGIMVVIYAEPPKNFSKDGITPKFAENV